MPFPPETLEAKIARVLADRIEITPYNPDWPRLFDEEKARLFSIAPPGLLLRMEHIGSTAVPGLAAKPIVDLLVTAASLEGVKQTLVPLLEAQGCDYFWRPTHGDDGPPWYAWFIRRNGNGQRTHHIHIVEDTPEFAGHQERILFRNHLREYPETAASYEKVKRTLAEEFPEDRVHYTRGKNAFILEVMETIHKTAAPNRSSSHR
jgi:GrpB-like predicted nucleotidyltransferase (UPF0157 family)